MKNKQQVFDVNRLFDWWSIPHFMFGIIMALATISFSWPVLPTIVGMLIVALLWEWLEKHVRLSEAPGNSWVDVALPLLAFLGTYFIVDRVALNHERYLGLLLITVLLYLFINMMAWRARFEKDKEFLG